MRWHVGAWASSQAAGATNADNPFVANDTVLLSRNSHLITTDPLQLREAFAVGASITDARFFTPSWASPSIPHLAPALRSATIPSRPVGVNLIERPWNVPQNEEIASQLSNNLGAASENEAVIGFFTPPEWTPTTLKGVPLNPMGPSELIIRSNATISVANLAWCAAVPLTFAESLKGGWYAIRACQVVVTGGLAYRFIFPRQMATARRPWRSGGLVSNALGDTPEELQWWRNALGDLGYFSAFEPPLLEVLSVTGGGTAVTLFMAVTYLGPADVPPPGVK